jgi:D-amino-acid dehydrogenase
MQEINTTIIGAGVVGIMTALHLQEEGVEVTVIDRQGPGEGCSRGNAGVLGSATCIPVSMPGTIKDVPKWLLVPDGPLCIDWKYSAKLLPWLIKFVKAGNRDRVEEISIALDRLHMPTVDIYKHYADLAGVSELVKQNGYLHIFESSKSFSGTKLGREIRERRNIGFDTLSSTSIQTLEPDLTPIYTDGMLIKRDGFTPNPLRLVQSLAKLFQERGGTLLQRDVTSIRFENSRPESLTTSNGKHTFDKLVVCAGAWSKSLLDQLGEKVSLESERGYHVMIRNPGVKLSRPVFTCDRKILATPMEDGIVLAGTAEYASLNLPPNYSRARALLKQGERMFAGLNTEDYSEWMGHRPATPDSMPVICQSKKHPSIYYAFGHGHTGLAGAPMTGKVVSELVTGKQPSIDITPFDLYRF